jgi:hypothetical protein
MDQPNTTGEKKMETLAEYIARKNTATLAWIEEAPGERWSTLIAPADYWNSQGIFTVEEFELDSARSTLWDFYKDVHGIRPRWMNVWSMTLEECEKMIASLERDWEDAEEDREREHAFYAELEKQEAWEAAEVSSSFTPEQVAEINAHVTADVQPPIGDLSILFDNLYEKQYA